MIFRMPEHGVLQAKTKALDQKDQRLRTLTKKSNNLVKLSKHEGLDQHQKNAVADGFTNRYLLRFIIGLQSYLLNAWHRIGLSTINTNSYTLSFKKNQNLKYHIKDFN